jgi:hypothetical protein
MLFISSYNLIIIVADVHIVLHIVIRVLFDGQILTHGSQDSNPDAWSHFQEIPCDI